VVACSNKHLIKCDPPPKVQAPVCSKIKKNHPLSFSSMEQQQAFVSAGDHLYICPR
jgi:hypothetical protein